VHERGHDAGGAVGGRGDDATARGVLFVHGERPKIHPVERYQRIGGPATCGAGQLRVQARRATLHLVSARQHASRFAAALHASLHHVPDAQQPSSICASLRQVRSLRRMIPAIEVFSFSQSANKSSPVRNGSGSTVESGTMRFLVPPPDVLVRVHPPPRIRRPPSSKWP
jgi:hypothetical protein